MQTSPVPAASAPAVDLRARAVDQWRTDRREAAFGLLAVTTITTVIWALTMFGGFFWPAFVMVAATLNLLRIQLMREQHIAEAHRRLERKQADKQRRLERKRAQEQPPRPEDEAS
jgi:hypothetical protein